MPPLLTHQKASQNDRRTPNVYFGSPTIKNSYISTKKNPRRILGPHFPTRTFLALLLFSVIQMFFLTMFKETWCFFIKKHFSGYLCFRDTVFFLRST